MLQELENEEEERKVRMMKKRENNYRNTKQNGQSKRRKGGNEVAQRSLMWRRKIESPRESAMMMIMRMKGRRKKKKRKRGRMSMRTIAVPSFSLCGEVWPGWIITTHPSACLSVSLPAWCSYCRLCPSALSAYLPFLSAERFGHGGSSTTS